MNKEKLGKYKHFKGNEYEVIGFAKHSETSEKLVIYKRINNPNNNDTDNKYSLWARPKSMFFEKVNIEGKKIPRFRYLK